MPAQPSSCLPACPQRMFAPALPSDVLVNVYINLNKLCLTVYQLHALQPNSTKVSRPRPPSHLPPVHLSSAAPTGPCPAALRPDRVWCSSA